MTAAARDQGWRIAGLAFGGLVIAGAIASVPYLRGERTRMQRETLALREAQRTGAGTRDSLADEVRRLRGTLQLELARAAARDERKLHLVIAVDSGTVALMRDGLALRTMPARFMGAIPGRGQRTISRITTAVELRTAPTVDSLGNLVRAAPPDTSIKLVTLDDGTILKGGDAAAAILGGVVPGPGARTIVLSRRDFDAIRPNLSRGMKAVLF